MTPLITPPAPKGQWYKTAADAQRAVDEKYRYEHPTSVKLFTERALQKRRLVKPMCT